nr:sugar ABC transporter permease [Streptococcus pneumoniae]
GYSSSIALVFTTLIGMISLVQRRVLKEDD